MHKHIFYLYKRLLIIFKIFESVSKKIQFFYNFVFKLLLFIPKNIFKSFFLLNVCFLMDMNSYSLKVNSDSNL